MQNHICLLNLQHCCKTLLRYVMSIWITVGKPARALATGPFLGLKFSGSRLFMEIPGILELLVIIHQHVRFRSYSRADFNILVTKKIIPSLSHLCKDC